ASERTTMPLPVHCFTVEPVIRDSDEAPEMVIPSPAHWITVLLYSTVPGESVTLMPAPVLIDPLDTVTPEDWLITMAATVLVWMTTTLISRSELLSTRMAVALFCTMVPWIVPPVAFEKRIPVMKFTITPLRTVTLL